MSGNRKPRSVDWSTFSTALTEDEVNACAAQIGPAILAFSVLEIHVAQTLSAALGISHVDWSDALAANISAVDKGRLISGAAGLFASGGAKAEADRMKRLSALFGELGEERNVIAHGTLGKCDGRLLIGSIQLSARLKLSGGTEKWIFFDELDGWHTRCREALDLTRTLKPKMAEAWARSRAREAED